jgi:hypothetical protein
MSWGILIMAVAISLLLVGELHLSIIILIPLVLLIMGIWIVSIYTSFFPRAWGIVLSATGGLWLLHSVYPLSIYVRAGIFLVVMGILVLMGTKK